MAKNLLVSVLVSLFFCLLLGGAGLGLYFTLNKETSQKIEKIDQRLVALETAVKNFDSKFIAEKKDDDVVDAEYKVVDDEKK